jgi:hypothetical protein
MGIGGFSAGPLQAQLQAQMAQAQQLMQVRSDTIGPAALMGST